MIASATTTLQHDQYVGPANHVVIFRRRLQRWRENSCATSDARRSAAVDVRHGEQRRCVAAFTLPP